MELKSSHRQTKNPEEPVVQSDEVDQVFMWKPRSQLESLIPRHPNTPIEEVFKPPKHLLRVRLLGGFLWHRSSLDGVWPMAFLPGASAIFITNAGAGSADAEKQVPCLGFGGSWSPAGFNRNKVTWCQGRNSIRTHTNMLHVWYIVYLHFIIKKRPSM